MSAGEAMIETGRAVIQPWHCDVMGHLNVRHYAAFFDDALYHLMAHHGEGPAESVAKGYGWADVRITTEFLAEVSAGAALVARSRIEEVSTKSIRVVQELVDLKDQRVCARQEVSTVCLDLALRRGRPISDDLRARLLAGA